MPRSWGTNDFKLKKYFKKVYQTTIYSYVQKIRLEKANLLLRENLMSVTEIATKVGYKHQGYFSSIFYKAYGVYPKDLKSSALWYHKIPLVIKPYNNYLLVLVSSPQFNHYRGKTMSKVVLITGASSGMGELTAQFLNKNGYTVYAGTRDKNLKMPNISGVNNIYIDVSNTSSMEIAVNAIIAKEGKIDVLVNNAGFGLVSTAEEVTDEEIFKQFDVNVFGLMKMTRTVLPFMREAKAGVIINISSFLGKMGLPLLSHYNASKYAVEGFVDSIRFEMAPYNVRVHSIQSGLFGTNFVKKGLVANSVTTSESSPYKELVAHFIPIVAKAINEGPSPQPIADAIKSIIEDKNSPISTPVGGEATTFTPLRKELSDEDFETKVKETFAI